MKKNIMKVAIIAAFGLFAGYTVYSSQKDEAALSNITLDNVEALAGENFLCPNGCYSNGYGCYCNGWHENFYESGSGWW